MGGPTGTATITVNAGAATQLVFQAVGGGKASGYLSPVKVAVEDQYGNIVTGDTSPVTLSVASGPGGFASASTISVAAVNGIATFKRLILRTSGTYTLSASDGTLVGGTSGSIVVVPGAASKLVIGDPQNLPASSTVTAGTVISPVVLVEDNYGNVVLDNSTQVSMTFGGVNLGTQLAVNGVATFAPQTLTVVGTKNVNASLVSSSLPLSNATTVSFVVTPAAASKLVITQSPSTGTAGAVLGPVKVAVEDSFGNLLTGDSSTVALSIGSGPGALTAGSTTSVAAVNGIATFSNLLLNTSGTYTLSVSDGALAGATSGNLVVKSGTASQLAFLSAPATGAVGLALSPSVTVAVEDQFGNVVTGNGTTITLAVGSGPGGFAHGSTASVAAINGIATFSNLLFNKNGTYTLSASDGALSGATSGSIAIVASSTKLVLKTVPSSGTAGTALASSLTVAIEDQFGNIVTGDTSMVTLSVATGPGGFASGSTISVAAVNGIATFSNLIFNTAGTYTLSVSDGTLTGTTSSTVVINAGAAAQLFFQAVGGGKASGYLSAVTVAVEDQYGNIVTGDTSPVTLSVASGPGGFASASTISVAAVNGIATFKRLILRTSGTYTLSASDGTLVGGTSGSIVVVPGAASKLVIGDPQNLPASSTVTAGTVISPVVLVEDNYGNVVLDNSTQVSMTFGGVNLGTQLAVNGVATFAPQTLTVVGTKNVNASLVSSSLPLSNATTVSFVVTPAAASKLVITQSPSTGTAGAVLGPVKVAVEDSFGNLLTGDSSTVALSIGSGPGALTAGSTTSVAAVNGIATFSNLLLNTSGTYTLSVSDGALSGATSGNLVVKSGTAS